MANSSVLLGTLDMRVGGNAPVYVVKATIDTTGDFTILTPGGTILNSAGEPVVLGRDIERFWVVGCDHTDTVSKTTVFKSGDVAFHKIYTSIGKEVKQDSFWLGGLAPGDALKINVTPISEPKEYLLHVVLGRKFEAEQC